MYSTNIRPESKVRGSLPLVNPEPKGQGFYQWQISDNWGPGSYICGILRSSHGSYDIYYGDVTLGCRASYVTMKTTYNYFLYFFVHSMAWFAPVLADLKITMVSHEISASDTRKQRRLFASITMLINELTLTKSNKLNIFTMEGEWGLWKGNIGLL